MSRKRTAPQPLGSVCDSRGAPPSGFGEQVTDQIVAIAARLDDEVQVLSPLDACPDNNIRTATGLRLIDFEGATGAQQAWQDRLQAAMGAGRNEPDWAAMDAAIRLASLVWCLVTVGWFLPGPRSGQSARRRVALRQPISPAGGRPCVSPVTLHRVEYDDCTRGSCVSASSHGDARIQR